MLHVCYIVCWWLYPNLREVASFLVVPGATEIGCLINDSTSQNFVPFLGFHVILCGSVSTFSSNLPLQDNGDAFRDHLCSLPVPNAAFVRMVQALWCWEALGFLNFRAEVRATFGDELLVICEQEWGSFQVVQNVLREGKQISFFPSMLPSSPFFSFSPGGFLPWISRNKDSTVSCYVLKHKFAYNHVYISIYMSKKWRMKNGYVFRATYIYFTCH